jgi:hypothetical protein
MSCSNAQTIDASIGSSLENFPSYLAQTDACRREYVYQQCLFTVPACGLRPCFDSCAAFQQACYSTSKEDANSICVNQLNNGYVLSNSSTCFDKVHPNLVPQRASASNKSSDNDSNSNFPSYAIAIVVLLGLFLFVLFWIWIRRWRQRRRDRNHAELKAAALDIEEGGGSKYLQALPLDYMNGESDNRDDRGKKRKKNRRQITPSVFDPASEALGYRGSAYTTIVRADTRVPTARRTHRDRERGRDRSTLKVIPEMLPVEVEPQNPSKQSGRSHEPRPRGRSRVGGDGSRMHRQQRHTLDGETVSRDKRHQQAGRHANVEEGSRTGRANHPSQRHTFNVDDNRDNRRQKSRRNYDAGNGVPAQKLASDIHHYAYEDRNSYLRSSLDLSDKRESTGIAEEHVHRERRRHREDNQRHALAPHTYASNLYRQRHRDQGRDRSRNRDRNRGGHERERERDRRDRPQTDRDHYEYDHDRRDWERDREQERSRRHGSDYDRDHQNRRDRRDKDRDHVDSQPTTGEQRKGGIPSLNDLIGESFVSYT